MRYLKEKKAVPNVYTVNKSRNTWTCEPVSRGPTQNHSDEIQSKHVINHLWPWDTVYNLELYIPGSVVSMRSLQSVASQSQLRRVTITQAAKYMDMYPKDWKKTEQKFNAEHKLSVQEFQKKFDKQKAAIAAERQNFQVLKQTQILLELKSNSKQVEKNKKKMKDAEAKVARLRKEHRPMQEFTDQKNRGTEYQKLIGRLAIEEKITELKTEVAKL